MATNLNLTPNERTRLESVARGSRDASSVRRAYGLLALADGETAPQVAQRLGVGRSTVYDWLDRFHDRKNEPIELRLADHAHPGRPGILRQQVQQRVGEVIDEDPCNFGYRATLWTASLLAHHLQRVHQLKASIKTISRALHDMGYRYKRPRYVLSRRDKHWRNAKGGSNVELETAHVA